MQVVGREQELAAAAEGLVHRRDACVVFDGAAGIGKTAIWAASVDAAAARGSQVLTARPTESDASIPFSTLADLLAQLSPSALRSLSRRQRSAIRSAVGDGDGAAPDSLALGLGVRGALHAAAESAPLVLAVDDVQWVDAASARPLEFALRRLGDARLSTLATQRTGLVSDLLAHLDRDRVVRVEIGGLSTEPLAEVVRRRLGLALPYPQARALAEASGGNPLFALELARVVQRDRLTLVRGTPPQFADSLGNLLGDRVASVRPELADALLTLALLSQPRVHDIDADLLAEAEALELVAVEGERVRFDHPLLRTAVYAHASREARRRRHLELAPQVGDPVERALHLALGTLVPDTALAASIEAAAERAARNGGYDTAATLLEHAARLTPDDGERVRRVLRAVEHAQTSGDLPRADALLATVETGLGEGSRAAYALLLRARRTSGDGEEAIELMQEARRRATGDAALLARVEIVYAGSLLASSFDAARAAAHAAIARAEETGSPALVAGAIAEAIFDDMAAGERIDWALVERALAIEERLNDEGDDVEPSPRVVVGQALTYAGELARARVPIERQLAWERERERPPLTLFHLAVIEWRAGNLDRARACIDELSEAIAAFPYWEANVHFIRAFVEATAGETDLAVAEIREAEQWYRRQAVHLMLVGCRSLLGFVALTLERYDEAASECIEGIELMRRLAWRETGVHAIYQNAIDALVALGRLDEAAELAEELERLSRATSRVVSLAGALRARAAIAAAAGDLSRSTPLCSESLALQERLPEPFELGRTHLLLGSVLRRARLAADARAELADAAAAFEAAGARLWVAKAHAEERRIGGRRPQQRLTPMEERVAALVAGGKTNREVAAVLFLSPKTVEWNLSKIYRKLRVSSRTELSVKLTPRG